MEILNPAEDRLIVRRVLETQTDGGLVIPTSQQKKQRQARAEVMAVGPLARDEYKAGDIILFVRSGIEFDFNNEELVCLKKSEVIGKIIRG